MMDKLDVADKCEAQADKEYANLMESLDRMNENSRAYPMAAVGSESFGNIGGLYYLAAKLRGETKT
jgi:hypothetical protein